MQSNSFAKSDIFSLFHFHIFHIMLRVTLPKCLSRTIFGHSQSTTRRVRIEMLLHEFCVFKVFLLCFYYVNGLCPYAHQFENVLTVKDDDDSSNAIPPSVITISGSYLSSKSFDTYATDCYQYVRQPPQISTANIENALKTAVYQTEKYTSIDIEAAAGAYVQAPRLSTDMDRINYFFESATRYIQETTCSSKDTTTLYMPTLQLDNFENFLNKNVTPMACPSEHSAFLDCKDKIDYRQMDGTCNNLERPLDGRAGDCMQRLLPPDYKDGINQFRMSADGTPLPNPIVLSTNLFGEPDKR